MTKSNSPVPTARQQLHRNYLVGGTCIAAFIGAAFAYQLPGLTAKAASLVVGYWAALPFVRLAAGHGFRFKGRPRPVAPSSAPNGKDDGGLE